MVNPLDRLLVDSQDLDAELLATVLEPYVRIDKRTAEIRGTAGWSSLTTVQRTVAYLLARKGMTALELLSPDDEKASPSLIENNTGVKGSTLRPILSTLYRERVLEKSGSEYFIPNYSIDRATRYLVHDAERGNDGS